MITKGEYVTDNSDLKIIIHKVRYQNDKYFKARYSLVNKHNGIIYDNYITHKFYFKNITHWKRVN